MTEPMPKTAHKPQNRKTPEELAKLYQGKANAARAKAGKKRRAKETRRKILAGAGLLGLADSGDEEAKRVLAKVKASLTRPQDQEVFAEPEPTKEQLDQKIVECVKAYQAASSEEEKRRLTAVWRQVIAAWERGQGKLHPFSDDFDREANGLGGIGEVLPGF